MVLWLAGQSAQGGLSGEGACGAESAGAGTGGEGVGRGLRAAGAGIGHSTLPSLPRGAHAFGGDAAPFARAIWPCLIYTEMRALLAVQAAVGTSACRLTGKLHEAIVTAIVRADIKHNNRLLTLGEFIAVTLQINTTPHSGYSIYIAVLAQLSEPSGSVQQLVYLAPRQPFRVDPTGVRLGARDTSHFVRRFEITHT